jgi:tRNA threonylcarbamoyladenosine biosynthesis protein TsaE
VSTIHSILVLNLSQAVVISVSKPHACVDVLFDLDVNEAQLADIASQWINGVTYPATIFLQGNLGAGKTTFVRACLRALGFQCRVKSPTYAWLESYELDQHLVHHIDLYRLQSPQQIETIGLRDCWQTPAWVFIEWPEKAQGYLPTANFTVELWGSDVLPDGRHLLICQHQIGH